MIRLRRLGSGVFSGLALAAALLAAAPASAVPARIILLRHGEKGNPWQSCPVGVQRARALVSFYIGKNAQKSLFRPGEAPRAILAISMHTLDTIYPVAQSWEMPVVFYSAMPEPVGDKYVISQDTLNERTRQAARDILSKPEWAGQTLLINWEHNHIAKTALDMDPAIEAIERKRSGLSVPPSEKITLYDLLGLNAMPRVPYTWPRETYDYFWIIDFDQQTGKPNAFSMVKQDFGPPFANLPHNEWGQPDGLDAASGCTR